MRKILQRKVPPISLWLLLTLTGCIQSQTPNLVYSGSMGHISYHRLDPHDPTVPHRIFYRTSCSFRSSSSHNLPVFSGSPLDSKITRLVKRTSAPLAFSSLPNLDYYDFSNPGETGDLYASLVIPQRVLVSYILVIDFWMTDPDSVDIKVYRTYEEDLEDYSSTPPADFATSPKMFDDCYQIAFNSTLKRILFVGTGCSLFTKTVELNPGSVIYNYNVRDLILIG